MVIRGRQASQRKREEHRTLAELEATLEAAEPDSLDWQFWCEILETVERFSEAEELAWKSRHIPKLRRAVKGVKDRSPFDERS